MKRSLNSGTRKLALVVLGSVWTSCVLAAQTSYADHSDDMVIYTAVALAACFAAILCGSLIWKKRARLEVASSAKTKISPAQIPAENSRPKLAEEEDFAKFLEEFRAGKGPIDASPKNPAKTADAKKESNADALKKFFAWVPDQTTALQRLVAKCRKADNPAERLTALIEISGGLGVLKSRTGIAELRPAWELATALEGLLRQLTRSVSNNTHSTMRTLENGVALLADLCVPEVRADLASNPATRILIVDDDQVSCHALNSAIKRAFDQPDVVQSGDAALALATKHRYDLIMLDVMMPGMDGFEVCAKIRETLPNRSTPVLFITTLKDFDSRSKLLVGGGNEVMGKPFMAFEITVKALTLILRSRLRNGDQVFHVAREAASHSNPAVNWPTLRPASVAADDDSPQVDVQPPALAKGQDSSAAMLPPEIFAPNDGKGPQQLSEKFLAFMPAYVAEVKQHVTALGEMDESAKRKEMAIRLHLRLQCLSRKIDVPTLRPAFELCRSLEGLLKKFVENPKNITETSVRTVSSALDLLKDLCIPGVRPDLVDKPQVRLLVVDDEPLARRALTGALQMAFTKPLTAETGEEALELAADHEFDIVFMDVCMPGMDGFAACSKIHETSRNNFTPVIFVTTLSDDEFRVRASQCGGADYVVKPFIFMEINLKALTIALRGRLEIDKLAQAPKTPVAA